MLHIVWFMQGGPYRSFRNRAYDTPHSEHFCWESVECTITAAELRLCLPCKGFTFVVQAITFEAMSVGFSRISAEPHTSFENIYLCSRSDLEPDSQHSLFILCHPTMIGRRLCHKGLAMTRVARSL